MMRTRPFRQIDVFGSSRYRGNPVAVILDGSGMTTEEMQRVANWTNLSETTFILQPDSIDADYKLRIFTPDRELPFAGHPTLGSCCAWLASGGRPKRPDVIVQECGIGLVALKRSGDRFSFEAPPPLRMEPLSEPDLDVIAKGLGITRADILHHSWCDNGPKWRGIYLDSAEKVLSLTADPYILSGLDIGVVGPRIKIGVTGPSAETDEADFEVRAFFYQNGGIAEDPVTGSLNAALAQWLISVGLAPSRYVAKQGTVLGRDGRVFVQSDVSGDGKVWIGGECAQCIEGSILC
jgi:PhzF family phenazine biosynthesis protein